MEEMPETIQELADELGDMLSPNSPEDAKLVQKGMLLFRQGMVSNLQIGDSVILAKVQDVMPCRVELDPAFVTLSECSCPTKDICRHQMAVFFAVYSRYGSVTDWIDDWREPVRKKMALSSWGLQTAKDLIKANGVLNADYSRWVQSFEVSFDTLLGSKKYTSPYVVPELFAIYQRRILASAPVEQEWRMLYELIATVVSFRKLAALSQASQHSVDAVRRAYLHVFQGLLDDAEELVGKIGVQTMPFDFDEFIVRLKDDSLTLLTVSPVLVYERVAMYETLWTGLFRNKAWREEEIGRIDEALKGLGEDESPLALMVAKVHLLVMLQEDERALKIIGGGFGAAEITPFMLDWIRLLSGMKAWKRVGPFIELFLAKIKGYLEEQDGYHSSASFVRTAMRAVGPFCIEAGRTDLFERALVQTLPYSYSDYEYMLFERGQYDRWAELQAFVGMNFSDLPRERVKAVEKEQPELLLGMLHQTVQSEIDQKNRGSYRLAVRHLKKLRTLYKKLKRVDDWQFFMDTLMERTKRLRAFHEECVRGKLVE